MNNSKSKLKVSILLLFVIAVVAIFGLVSCGDKVEQIYITNAHKPRVDYVQGQELDLTNGLITVVIDGEESLIPMSSEEVSISGYDKNVIGTQTVTFTYKEKSATLSVNVIARAVAEGFEKGYFVGDAFKYDKGRLKIANDDAKTFTTVPFSDGKVSIKSFDSATAGNKTVTAEYTNGTTTYSCNFNVTIYEAADISIVYPSETKYYSHETALKLDGYLIVKATGSANIDDKYVDITPDMVSGFDISAVTPANYNNPLTQNLTITYLNKTFEYNITITYSGVSIIKDNMKVLNNVDLSGEEITLTEAEGNAAVSAITEYYKIPGEHKPLITEDELDVIVRCATVELNNRYANELAEYDDVILLSQKGLQLAAKTFERTVVTLAVLDDPDALLNEYAELLRHLKEDFADTILVGEKKIADEVLVLPIDTQDMVILALEHIIEMHNSFKVIPDDWTKETLSEYANVITTVTSKIDREEFYEKGNSAIYGVLSSWREKDDFFEIIYTYFMYVDTDIGGGEYVKSNILPAIPMPRTFGSWYTVYYNTIYISQALAQQTTQLYLRDVSQFMYYYDLLLKKTEELIENSEDTLTLDLYKLIDGDECLQAARASGCGYYYHASAYAENTNFNAMWDSYLELYTLYATGKLADSEGKLSFVGHESVIEDVVEKFMKLSPSELYGFISSMNFLYNQVQSTTLVLSKFEDKGYLNTLAMLLNGYYKSILSEDAYEMFETLMVAMENFALNGKKKTAVDDFKTAMKTLTDAYAANADAAAEFTQHFGTSYTKYSAIYNVYANDLELNLNASDLELLDALYDTITKIAEVYDYILSLKSDSEETEVPEMKEGTYIVLYALYEKATAIYNQIAINGQTNNDLLLALYTKLYTISENQLTLEKAFSSSGQIYWYYVTGLSLTLSNTDGTTRNYNVYDIYSSTNIGNYLASASDLLYAQYTGNYSNLTKEYVLIVIDSFHALDRTAAMLLRAFSGHVLHYDAIETYFASVLENDEKALALSAKLVQAARDYLEYAFSGEDEEKLNAFITTMEEAKALYDELGTSDGFDEYLAKLYTNYYELYDNIINPKDPEPSQPEA